MLIRSLTERIDCTKEGLIQLKEGRIYNYPYADAHRLIAYGYAEEVKQEAHTGEAHKHTDVETETVDTEFGFPRS